jgi:hypothetical protein
MQLGERQLADRSTGPLYRTDDGRQLILNDDGEPAYGVFLKIESGRLDAVRTFYRWSRGVGCEIAVDRGR